MATIKHLRHFNELKPKQQRAIILIFQGKLKLEEIAKTLHVAHSTLWHWRQDDDFLQAQHEYASSVLNKAVPVAVRELINMIRSNRTPAQVRLASIQTVLKHANMLSDKDTPQLTNAKVKKLESETNLTNAKAKLLKNGDKDESEVLGNYLHELGDAVKNDGKSK